MIYIERKTLFWFVTPAIVAIAAAYLQWAVAGLPAVEVPSAPIAEAPHGFPAWLRLTHYVNLLFIILLVRSGLQILADHPRLYWGRDCTPGTDWFRFQVPVPKGRIWTAKDDSVTLPTWLGIPGLRHTLGLSRWWHFSVNLLWLINGVAFYLLLFSTDQWRRLVPLTWEVFQPRSRQQFNMPR